MGSGGQREDDTESSVAGITPHTTRLFGTVTPEPDNTLTTHQRRTRPLVTATRRWTCFRDHLTQRGFAPARRRKEHHERRTSSA